ncbi:MAG: hypothetical protein WCE93_00900, partial [Nitrososphaeraceae archaeon]
PISSCLIFKDNSLPSYLKIKHRWNKQLANRRKVQEMIVARNPLSNLSLETSINPLKIPV